MKAKIVVIGAGSYSFGTMTVRDILECSELKGSQIVLVDINPERLDRMTRLAHRLNQTWDAEFEITSTTERREALPGADIVVGAVEQRRYPMWRLDIEIPMKHGCQHLYGENGGPGGMFHTLRQVPVMLGIAHDIERLCPDAWFVNMSNPESRLTLAINRYTRVKTVGVCLGTYITRHSLASRVLGLPPEEVDVKAAGINHCHWVIDIRHNGSGEDLYPLVRERIEQVDPQWQPLSCECLRRFGLFPGPADSHVGEYLGWGWQYMPAGYTDWITNYDATEAEIRARMEAYASGTGPLERDELEQFMVERGSRWQTIDIILSLLDNGNRYVLALNVPNDGYITNLKRDAVVEVPAVVGADRIYGLGMGSLPPAIATLLELQLQIMDLNVEAAVTGNRQTALEALMIDPCVPNPTAAAKMLDEMLITQADLLPQFK